MARSTSIEAYDTIKQNGLLSDRRFQIYSMLYQYGPCTAGELYYYMKNKLGVHFNANANVSARLNELRQMQVVCEVGKKVCAVTEMQVLLWQVTDKLPVNFKKPETKDQKIKRLEKEIEFLKDEIFRIKFT